MLFDLTQKQLWSLTELQKHHKEHHEREDELLELLRRLQDSRMLHDPAELCSPDDNCNDCDLMREVAEELKDE